MSILSPKMRDLLLEHANGPRPFIAGDVRGTFDALEIRGMIRQSADRKHTVATTRGREWIVQHLAREADVLTMGAV